MKKALLLFVSLVLAASLFASNLQMGQSELNQSFPAATRMVVRITANTGSVTIFNHVTWYIPQ